jgi:serine/threonine protein kinase
MEIYEKGEIFVEKDGDYVFDHTKIIFHGDNDEFYYAKTNQRILGSSQVDIDGLDLNRIPADHVWPLAEPTFTRAPNPLPSDCYLKRPSLLYYEDAPDRSDYGRLILSEVEACEVFRSRPHPNIARYLGCVVKDGRIRGLCFVRYPVTLSQMLKDGTRLQSSICLRGIEAGIQHMHDLGFVHNDLNSSNIMMDGENPIIIDFDSCKRVGDRLGLKSGTFGGALVEEEFARRENDIHSLSEIRATLTKREL